MSTSLTSATIIDKAALGTLHGELEGGRNPAWFLQDSDAQLLAPEDASDGVSLLDGANGGAIQAHFNVRVRRKAAYRTAIFQIATVTNSVDYVVTITSASGAFSSTYTSDGSATKQEIAEGLAVLIMGDSSGDLYAYGEEDPTSGEYRLRVTGKQNGDQGNADFVVDGWSVDGAANGAELTVSADPNYVEIVFWGLPGGSEGAGEDEDVHQGVAFIEGSGGQEEFSRWSRVTAVTQPTTLPELDLDGKVYVPFGGLLDRLDVRGLQRIHIQVVGIHSAGDQADVTMHTPAVLLGPCVRESRRSLAS